MMGKFFVAVMLGLIAVGNVGAQQNCNVTQSMTFDPNQLAGVWYEIAREPAPIDTYQCVQVNFTVTNNDALDIVTTYNNAASFPWVNNTMSGSITSESDNGYNITFLNGMYYTPPAVFKLLATDYVTYALICGYQDPSDISTYFGVILMRNRYPPADQVEDIELQAEEQYAQFQNGSMAMIYQSDQCYAPGAGAFAKASLPLLAALLCLRALLHF